MTPKLTPEEAIYDALERLMRIETVLTGVPNTEDKGLCGTVKKHDDEIDAVRKKVGRLEVRFILLVGLLLGSGVLGGIGISQLVN